VDRASNSKGSEIGIVLATPKGTIIEQSFTLGFTATNNEAEYEGMVVAHGVTELEVYFDSLLIVSQVKGEYTAKDD